ncbi:MAG: glycosyltransferase family 2 protein [Casimicrobiaceae bacterium]
MVDSLQAPFDVAVVMTTIVRPTLAQAMRSVFAQRFGGRIQILLGIDRWEGDRALVEQLIRECPSQMAVTLLDFGYSTSQRNGGVYPSSYGGALKTILSFAANSRHVTYLDDDNYYAPDHVASMLAAIDGNAWAFSLRHFVDAASDRLLCADTWESLGPGRGVYAAAQGGFVDTNCFFLDTLACSDVFAEWAMTRLSGGTGGDRQVLQKLRDRPWASNGAHSLFYRTRLAGNHPYLLWRFKCAGVDLSSFMAAGDIPGEAAWQRCAEFDRQVAGGGVAAVAVQATQ